MSQKTNVPTRGTRPDIVAQGTALPQGQAKAPLAPKRGGADSARAFYSRRARTDAAVRTMPGLRNFGN